MLSPVKNKSTLKHAGKCRRSSNKGGFALVVTLSLMILLTVIAVGLLTLSSISLRQSSVSADMATAKANARMAMMLAIGELQLSTGPDTRVTATADSLLGSPQSPVTGAWKSWENSDLDSAGRPEAPDYPDKKILSGAAGSPGRFLGWLVSQPSSAAPDPQATPPTGKKTGRLQLLSSGTLGSKGDPAMEVHLEPCLINQNSNKGSYGWWVSGENAKANLSLKKKDSKSAVDARNLLASNGRPDEEALEIQFKNPANLVPLLSRKTLDLAATASEPPSSDFHDLTTTSRGLLTNTAGGGWRKDLSLLSEYGLATAKNAPAPDQHLYPFTTLRGSASSDNWERFGAVVRWPALLDYMTQYRGIKGGSSSGITDFPPMAGGISAPAQLNDFLDKTSRHVIVADYRCILAYSAIQTGATAYDAAISLNPVITLWNPWNYRIKIDEMRLSTASLPLAFNMRIKQGVTSSPFTEVTFRSIVNATDDFKERTKFRLDLKNASGGAELTLGPGETMVLSPASPTLVFVNPFASSKESQIPMELRPGYRTYGGYQFKIPKQGGGFFSGSNTAVFEISQVIPKANIGYANSTVQTSQATGMYLDAFAKINGASRHYNAKRFFFGSSDVNKWIKPVSSLPTAKLSEAAVENKVFASTALLCRTANDTVIPSRVAHASSPLTLYDESGRAASDRIGAEHPVNTPFEFVIRKHSGWNDTLIANNLGYVASGTAADNGLNRCIIAEVPLRPVSSLVELQHFQPRGANRAPPYRTNILGNSTASPLFPSAAVSLSTAATNAQWDDSYVMNRLFFDDWFVSSIAPETDEWSGTTKRSLEQVYRDHLSSKSPLPNRHYLTAATASDADLGADTRHETIASRLVVDGMFNVNSTSVAAWRALLSHARDQAVPVLSSGGVSLAEDKGHAVARTTTPGDLSADNSLSSYQRFGGHRRLSNDQINALAEEIVKQIRLRGPALGLSEFVNRQLKGGADSGLALAGVIQAALDNLAKQGNSPQNPFRELQPLCKQISAAQVPADASYSFPDAAQGWSGEGLPGWITQADILRPLAPVLSARDDTFVIRSCGTALAPDGKTVKATAWCETVVQREAGYISPTAGNDPASDQNLTGAGKDINSRFGRRFQIISFRWLSKNEV